MIPLKRIGLIIDGLSLLPSEIRVLWIHLGDGEERRRLQEQADVKFVGKSNIEYEFKGYLDNEQIHKFYEEDSVDLFITTSETEGCPG